jgi:DNA-binding NarL/FixJ family response regulator
MDTKPKVGPVAKGEARSRVLVVDDHPLVCEGLADLINRQQDLRCCGTATNVLEAQKAVNEEEPDLLLLDLRLGEGDGLELIKLLKAQFAGLRILVLSQLDETLYAERALRAGAHGYVMKEQATEEVLHAIRAVIKGQIYVSQKIGLMALRRMVEDKTRDPVPELRHLSEREIEVFKAIGAGKGTREIAADMHLSSKTIETYREHLKYKLGATTASQLVEYARKWTAGEAGIEIRSAEKLTSESSAP